MSLARNPDMSYVAAGRQDSPYHRMNVRSHVYVPDADVRADYDGRPAYMAPAETRRAPFRIPMKAVVIIVGLTLFVLGMFTVSASARRAALYKEGQAIYNEIQSLDRDIIVLKEQIAKAQEPNNLRYQASQRLGMINSEGVEPIEINAPETRPNASAPSLAGAQGRSSLNP